MVQTSAIEHIVSLNSVGAWLSERTLLGFHRVKAHALGPQLTGHLQIYNHINMKGGKLLPAENGGVMAQSVKLADDVMSVVRRESGLQSRSVAGQITHWINIGRAIEKSDAFNYQHISAALAGELSPDALSAEEQEVWFAQFADDVSAPTAQEEVFFAQRRQLGRGVGLTEKGDLIYSETAT